VNEVALVAERLTKTYGRDRVVDELSFSVAAGRVTAFLGPNGSGKSTTLRMLLGLASPTSGAATVFGVPARQLSRPADVVGALVDGMGFHPGRTARQHLQVAAAVGGIPTARVDAALDAVGLVDDAERRVGGYSLGMRQRLGLATALLGDPAVLVLDEPANGLDPAGIRWLRRFLVDYARSGRTVFLSSHVLSEVAHFADEVVVIQGGRLVTQTTMSSFVGAAVTVQTPDPTTLARLLEQAGGSVRAEAGGRLTVEGLAAPRVGDLAFAAGVVLHELAERRRDVEGVFLDLMEGTST
jgi:ABC-2 type transport system ATP-binding protein